MTTEGIANEANSISNGAEAPPGRRITRIATWTVAFSALFFALGRFFEGFDDDDMQHLHAAWLCGRGMVPYRDYFDHHMPLFHVLSGPYTHWIGNDPFMLLLTSRLLALFPAGLALFLFWRLSPRSAGPLAAWLGVLLLVTSRHIESISEYRPDYCAAPCILAGVILLCRRQGNAVRSALWSGLLVGVGLLFSQKMLAVAPAFVVWQVAAIFHANPDRRTASLRLTALCAGIALPLLLLVLWLIHQRALREFMAGPIGFAWHWKQAQDWRLYAQEAVLINFPAMVLGFSWAFRSVWIWLRQGDEAFAGDGLLGLMVVIGTAAYLRTPAPTEQAFLLAIQFWVLACAARQVIAWVTGETPALQDRLGRISMFCGMVVSLAALKLYNAATATLLSILLAWWGHHIMQSEQSRQTKTVGIFAVLFTIPALVAIVTSADRINRAYFRRQVESMRAMNALIPPNGQVLTMWPVYTPLFPHANYHWFSDPGMYTSTPPGMLRDEYFAAMADPRTAMVVCEPSIVGIVAPEILERIRTTFVEVPMPRELRRVRVFVRPRERK